jgi:hypothetical protein
LAGFIGQFAFTDAEGNRRNLLGRDPRFTQRAEKRHVGVAVDGVENDIRFRRGDSRHDCLHIGFSQRDIILAHHLRAQGLDLVADHRVGRARENVVGTHQIKPPAAQVVEGPFYGGNDLLVRGCAEVDDIG